MGSSNPLSPKSAVIVDANIFFAIGRPSNPKYRRFRQVVQEAGVVLKLPDRVVAELGGPETDRIQRALAEGWVEVVNAPSLKDSDAVTASDIARRTIANTTGRAEHEVEKTDTILAGLAIQYLRDIASSTVIVITDDRPAKAGIETAVRELGYEDAVTVFGLADVIGEDPGESIRPI